MPNVPKAALRRHDGKPLMVNFVVDQEGRVRVPVRAEVQDAALAETVLAAVCQWRYSPPTQKGVPVAVEMTRALVLPEGWLRCCAGGGCCNRHVLDGAIDCSSSPFFSTTRFDL